LMNNSTASPDLSNSRAFPIRVNVAPRFDAVKVLKYLSVANAPRYRPEKGLTFCNIFACDYCYLMGLYLPRVWWNNNALDEIVKSIKAEETPTVESRYGSTVNELNANSLNAWLPLYGPNFGWESLPFTPDGMREAQSLVNRGATSVISASTMTDRPGHISVIIPEDVGQKWKANEVTDGDLVGDFIPVQAQAGSRCFTGVAWNWWALGKYPRTGLWVNRSRVPVVSPVEMAVAPVVEEGEVKGDV
jgi:hypothetical protein